MIAARLVRPSMRVRPALGLLLSLVFGTAAVTKVSAFAQLTASIAKSELLPERLIAPFAVGLIAVEGLVTVGLLFGRTRQAAARAASLLSATFLGYTLWRAYYRIPAPCNCFGTLFRVDPKAGAIICLALLLIAVDLAGTGASARRA